MATAAPRTRSRSWPAPGWAALPGGHATAEVAGQRGAWRQRAWSLVRGAAPLALAAALAVAAAALWFYAVALAVDRLDSRSSEPREDIVAFYVAGKLLREGHVERLYDVQAVAAEEAALLGRPAGYHGGLPFLNPPFVAGLFYPLTLLPYGVAQAVWLGLSAAALAAALALLWPELRRLQRKWAVVFVLAALASAPVFWSLLYGQLSPLVLLSWVASYRLLKAGREGAAGLVLAACLIKPPLAVVPALFLLTTGRWRAFAGFAAGGALLGAASLALVGLQTALVDYPRLMLDSTAWRSEYGIDRPHMFGWNGLLSLLLDGRAPELERALGVAASLATLAAAVYVWRRLNRQGNDAGLALAVTGATVLLSPHIHLQDLQVMILPAALLVAHRRGVSEVLLPAALFVLAPLSLAGPNLVTPLLAGSLAYQLRRALAGVSLPWRLPQVTAERLRSGVAAVSWQAARRLRPGRPPVAGQAPVARTMATTTPTR
jgi:hypothetical protein